jgi:hypothetical protein
MKETAIVAPVFECSGCKYWSLHKTNATNHISKKCPDAKLVSKKKIVKHQDPNNERDDITTLYQCSKCSYTSYASSNVNAHIKKCSGAELIKEQRKLFIEDVPPEPKEGAINQDITNNGNVNSMATSVNGTAIGTINLNVQLIMPAVNSQEEFAERVKIMLQSVKDLNFESSKIGLAFADGDFKPVELLKALNAENPQLDNKKFYHNSVVCLKTGETTPLKQYCRQELVNLHKVPLETIKKAGLEDDLDDKTAENCMTLASACVNDKKISVVKHCLKYDRKLELSAEEREKPRAIVDMLAKGFEQDNDFEKKGYNETLDRVRDNLETSLTDIKQQNINKEKKILKNKQGIKDVKKKVYGNTYVEKVTVITKAEEDKNANIEKLIQVLSNETKKLKCTVGRPTNEVKIET